MKPCMIWAQKSTQRPTLMMRTFMLDMSMVRPHQCMKPATSVQVRRTHIITSREPRQLPRVTSVVMKIQTGRGERLVKYLLISLI